MRTSTSEVLKNVQFRFYILYCILDIGYWGDFRQSRNVVILFLGQLNAIIFQNTGLIIF
jgi:hypothetical protein